MASSESLNRLLNAQGTTSTIRSSPQFQRFVNFPQAVNAFNEAQAYGLKWVSRIDRFKDVVPDSLVDSVTRYIDSLSTVTLGQQLRQNETIEIAIRRVKTDFQTQVPAMSLDFLDATGMLDLPGVIDERRLELVQEMEKILGSSTDEIRGLSASLESDIRKTADDAVQEYELAKEKASRITVDSAREQFQSAERNLRSRAFWWTLITVALFTTLGGVLIYYFVHPPAIIRDIEDALGSGKALPTVSIPLLLAASAYFTSLRLALVGVLGLGFAVSIRMMRAYFHMKEHNEHKLRVTNSIEAFVAAVRTKEQKDLVLGKLVESVIDFGDSGILGKQTESSSLPSVIMEAITKNVSKSD